MTLSYDLCVKLKENGFDQSISEGGSYWVENKQTGHFTPTTYTCDECNIHPAAPLSMLDYEWAKIPSLSELIEACGWRLDDLVSSRHGGDPRWLATAYPCEECGWVDMFNCSGKTPEEAVANLWLALNEKKK